MIDDTINDAKTVADGGKDMILAGRYRILRRLGQGGMGSVWLAEDRQLDNRKVAIKMLPTIVVQDKRAYQQLKGEALVSLKLIHPNIVTLRAFEENNGAPFLVMDYIEGQTLSDCLAVRGKLSEAETIKLLKPIAAALDYAHSEKVIHRDVKPSNIIIRKDGHPFILDFGIAREIQESMTRVTGRTISGTLLYMSPEQLRGAPPKPAQDVYSFSAMAYECLAGQPPFIRGQIEYQIVNEKPTPLPGVSRFVTAIMSGLEKNPEGRPKSCTAVVDIDKFSRVEHVERVGGRIGLGDLKENKGGRTKPTLWAVSAVLAVAVIAVLYWGLAQYNADAKTLGKWDNRIGGEKNIVTIKGGNRYCIIDLSLGANATHYPVSYLSEPPPGGFNTDEYKTKKLVLRRIEPGKFKMCGKYDVMLTKPFYCGLFEITQKQYMLVKGDNPSFFKDPIFPVEQVTWHEIRGSSLPYNWPKSTKVEPDSFMGRLQARTGLSLDLPTEAQWEYACRAGTTSEYHNGGDSEKDLIQLGRYKGNQNDGKGGYNKIAKVGSYLPNAWGLYDMHGNVWEPCLDWYGECQDGVVDPVGPFRGPNRVFRGGGWFNDATCCTSSNRGVSPASFVSNLHGFRVVETQK